MSIGTMVIELREFKEEKKKKNNMDKMGKLNLLIFLTKSGIFMKYSVYSLVLTCIEIIKSHNKWKLKIRTEFPDVWGEYKYHGNPYVYTGYYRSL